MEDLLSLLVTGLHARGRWGLMPAFVHQARLENVSGKLSALVVGAAKIDACGVGLFGLVVA